MKENFTNWVKFADRKEKLREELKSPGIYAIAYFKGELKKTDFNYTKEIVYFGMTNSIGGLKSRLRQFDNTINNEKSEHGGALRFRGDKKDLYVSVWPFNNCDVKILDNGSIKKENKEKAVKILQLMGEVAKAEYFCFAKYVELFGEMPRFNNKKDNPKG